MVGSTEHSEHAANTHLIAYVFEVILTSSKPRAPLCSALLCCIRKPQRNSQAKSFLYSPKHSGIHLIPTRYRQDIKTKNESEV